MIFINNVAPLTVYFSINGVKHQQIFSTVMQLLTMQP